MRVALTLIGVLVACSLAMAIPTGLNAMPTADVLTLGESRTDFETSGTGKLFAEPDGYVYGAQTGLILGLEGGIDHVSGGDTLYNLKWRFKSEGLLPSLAVGGQGLGSNRKGEYYLVTTRSLLVAQVHAGVLRDQDTLDTMTMLGANAGFGPIILKADAIRGGSLARSSISAGLRISNFTVAGTYYDIKNAPHQTTITLSYFSKAF